MRARTFGLTASMMLAFVLQAQAAPLPPSLDLREPPPAEVRGRATGTGALLGAAAAGSVALLLSTAVCLLASAEGEVCNAGEWVGIVGGFTVGSAVAGGIVGGSIGAAWPVARPADADTPIWDRASGEIGTASLHLGASSVGGRDGTRRTAPALRTSVLVRLGPYLALGPEAGRYSLRGLAVGPSPWRDSTVGNQLISHDSWFMAMALRLGVPLGPIYPYALANLGYYKDYGNGGGGSLGGGLEWRLGDKLALAADARFHRGSGDPKPPSFVTGTAGVVWNW
jgi:hypothetical protein